MQLLYTTNAVYKYKYIQIHTNTQWRIRTGYLSLEYTIAQRYTLFEEEDEQFQLEGSTAAYSFWNKQQKPDPESRDGPACKTRAWHPWFVTVIMGMSTQVYAPYDVYMSEMFIERQQQQRVKAKAASITIIIVVVVILLIINTKTELVPSFLGKFLYLARTHDTPYLDCGMLFDRQKDATQHYKYVPLSTAGQNCTFMFERQINVSTDWLP